VSRELVSLGPQGRKSIAKRITKEEHTTGVRVRRIV
jgi:hypothetical protein